MTELREQMQSLAENGDTYSAAERLNLIHAFLDALNRGEARSAAPDGAGGWTVNTWVKQGILTCFKHGALTDMTQAGHPFYDKDTLPLRPLALSDSVRLVPGGSSIRTGAYVAPGVICMPPMYINIGAYVDSGSMVDSHALVGTCAQIGKNVHISAAAQIGGVLEPAGASPVIIEDEVMVGGNCGVYEGVRVGARAVLGSGVILNASTPLFDNINRTIIRADENGIVHVPPGAVVIAGSRAMRGDFAEKYDLAMYTPIIVKYRDEKTDARTALEQVLR